MRRAISSTPSKVTRLQGLQGLRGSLSDKFQRYSPSFDIIIIIIILEVDIRGCEVARVSRFRRAISTHITCHIYTAQQRSTIRLGSRRSHIRGLERDPV